MQEELARAMLNKLPPPAFLLSSFLSNPLSPQTWPRKHERRWKQRVGEWVTPLIFWR